MEKNIKDYLHLYLGCEVMYEGDKLTLYSVNATGGCHASNGRTHLHGISNRIKPILRPLSDMTEEEGKEGWRFVTDNHYNGVTNPKHALVNGNLGISTQEWANITRYLLSKSFDLFSLIESGLAIDKTKLPTHA